MTKEIKAGDKVRVSKDAPRMYVPDWDNEKFCAALIVKEVNDGNASVLFEGENPYKTVQRIIPTKYLIKVDAEAKEEKFKYQVGQKVILQFYGGEVSTITEAFRDGGVWNKYKLKMLPNHVWNENELDPYIEPTEQTDAGTKTDEVDFSVADTPESIKGRIKQQTEAEKTDSDIPFSIFRDGELSNPRIVNLHNGMHYWQHYEADLAKEVVLKVANKYEDPKKAAEYAVQVAKAVVEGLKRR